ncbi:MAG TPA: phosphatidylglycerophosphatase A [Planctomycetota bacterium]|nr:phosphatidylglycerophosphatase A [Planctomycetota bacterium]
MSFADRLRWLLATGCGLGLAPVASGTFGTLGGVAVALLLQLWLAGTALGVALLAAALVLLAAGCSLTDWTERILRAKDPKPFVLDEIVGYLVALAILALVRGDPSPTAHVAAFLVFRAFDVVKPWPASRLEYVPGAPGIMLDDCAAGVYSGIVLSVLPWLGLTMTNP